MVFSFWSFVLQYKIKKSAILLQQNEIRKK